MTKKNSGLRTKSFRLNKQWMVDNLSDYNGGYVKDLQNKVKTGNPREQEEAKQALEFLEQFNNEYYKASINKEDALHNTKELRTSVYSANNSANRDLYNRTQIGGKLLSLQEEVEELLELEGNFDPLDFLIAQEEITNYQPQNKREEEMKELLLESIEKYL